MSVETAAARQAAPAAPLADSTPEAPMPRMPGHWRSLPRVFVSKKARGDAEDECHPEAG